MKKLILLFILFFTLNSFSQEKNLSDFKGKTINGALRTSFIPVQMPTDFDTSLDKTMGLLGIHYQLYTNQCFYLGAAMKAAMTGDQGGLFTLGVEAGSSNKLIGKLYSDVNLHFAGGGGYRYLVNGGAMINANIGLAYKTKDYSFGVQYSHVDFFTGEIKSNSVSFYVEIPTFIRTANYKDANLDFYSDKNNSFWNQVAVNSVQQVRFDFFYPIGKSKKDNGETLDNTLYVLGFEYQKYLGENYFLYAHTDAIYNGLRAGFMDLFVGAGYNFYRSKNFNLFGKLGIGAAGGRIAPEGGVTTYPSAGFDVHLSDKFSLSGHGGYYRALDGDFEAYTLGFGLKYKSITGGTKNALGESYTKFKTQGIRVSVEQQTYKNVKKTDARTTDLQQIALKVGYDISERFYLVGEASFAYEGESGGYAHGLVGVGYETPKFLNNLSLFTELMTGAAGGGGVDTGEGIVVRPLAGLNYHLSNNLELHGSLGLKTAPFGGINTTNYNVGISYRFATLSAK